MESLGETYCSVLHYISIWYHYRSNRRSLVVLLEARCKLLAMGVEALGLGLVCLLRRGRLHLRVDVAVAEHAGKHGCRR